MPTQFSMNGRPRQDCRGQSSFYDKLLVLGPLTDKKIEEYKLAGKYGPELQQLAQERESEKKREKRRVKESAERRKKMKQLIDDLL